MTCEVSFYTTGDSIPSDLEVSVTASYLTDEGMYLNIIYGNKMNLIISDTFFFVL